MIEKLKEYLIKKKEIISYIIFGGLTTVVNFAVYIVCAKLFGINEIVANIIAWIISVLFAYITNKIYVFESKSKDIRSVMKEMISFFACRLASLVVFDIFLFWLLVDLCDINDIIVKIINNILTIIANYIFSKIVVFKNNSKK